MKKLIICIITGLCSATVVSATSSDSIKPSLNHFVAVNSADGFVFSTNKFVSGAYRIPHYTSFTLKYGLTSSGDNWEDFAYGLRYMGIGAYMANFYREDDLGTPFSLFFFQGARLYQFSPRITLNYEWNLGGAFNWKYYDEFDNPDNIALGSPVNIHVSGNLLMKWRTGQKWDLSGGLSFTHFSNGAYSYPNKGLNAAAAFVELSYHFNREKEVPKFKSKSFDVPTYEKHVEHDLMFLISMRHAKVDTLGTGLAGPYTNRKFNVLGLSYSHTLCNNYRYKWGPSIEATYDESSGIVSWNEKHPENGRYYDRIRLGKFYDRFSAGLSLKGEVSMPFYSVFAHMGYDIIHGNDKDNRLYQIMGIKVYLKDNLFGTFGIRATNFGKAQYLYWNLGYTISRKKKNS